MGKRGVAKKNANRRQTSLKLRFVDGTNGVRLSRAARKRAPQERRSPLPVPEVLPQNGPVTPFSV
jgi:hypothetical protein